MEPTIQQLPKSTHTLVVSYLGVRRAIGAIGKHRVPGVVDKMAGQAKNLHGVLL